MKYLKSMEEGKFRLSEAASIFADSPLIITQSKIIDFADYNELTFSTAQNLRKEGLGARDRIGIFSHNCPEYLILLGAIFKIKAIAVLLNTRFPQKQILDFLDRIDTRTVIYSNRVFKNIKLADINLPDINRIVSPEKDLKEVKIDEEEILLDQGATIISTSGSTSIPKAVLHTFGNHYFNALGSNLNIPFGRRDSWLLTLPFYHVGGVAIFFRALISSGTVVIPHSDESLSDSILRFQPTHISLVATQLYRLLEEKKALAHLKRMKALLLGGGSIPPNLIRESIKLGLQIHTSYGSTEMASQITTSRPGESPEKLYTSGKLLKHRQLRISTDGEILVKGKTLFKGYVNHQEIQLDLNAGGWFASGDLGILDSDGYLIVTGRKDNMFISGGENIQPDEIEKELSKIEGVKEVIVVPVKNKEFGERPVAFIKMESDWPEKVSFQNYLKGKISRFKIPDHFFPMPESEKNRGIKQSRTRLKNLAERLITNKI